MSYQSWIGVFGQSSFATGPYSPSSFAANNILTGNGTSAIQASGATITNSGNTLTFAGGSNLADSSGQLTLSALGTNKSIVMLPTGSGSVIFGSSTALSDNLLIQVNPASGNFSGISFNNSSFPSTQDTFGIQLNGGSYAQLYTNANIPIEFKTHGLLALTLDTSQNATFTGAVSAGGSLTLTGKAITYNGVSTAGYGLAAIVGSGRSTAQTAAVASVAAYTNAAADGSFVVDANVLVTASTTHAFTVTCTYTDEGNTSRIATLNFSQIAGTIGTSIANAAGAVPYEGLPLHIRVKASTTITVATTGTFTSVTYNVEANIRQVA